jgi:sulfur relay (sulfurtransferase) DsrF/TusC family protein
MAKRILQILTTGYRATLEEQDDQILWLTHTLRNNGAEIDILLRGTAANYAVSNQDARGLAFGEREQTQPPDIAFDVRTLISKGVRVFVLTDDLMARGVRRNETIEDLGFVTKSELPSLLRSYDQVWQW